MAKTGDINANLWAGLALLVIAGFMATWWIISSKAESAKSTESAENKDKSLAFVAANDGGAGAGVVDRYEAN